MSKGSKIERSHVRTHKMPHCAAIEKTKLLSAGRVASRLRPDATLSGPAPRKERLSGFRPDKISFHSLKPSAVLGYGRHSSRLVAFDSAWFNSPCTGL